VIKTLISINQDIYKEMQKLNLLNPVVVTYQDGTPIRDADTRRIIVNKKCTIANRHKSSKAKTYLVDEPVYKQYLNIKSKQSKK
jgi:hypothetical protein